MMPGERAEFIIDFAGVAPGTDLVLNNRLGHVDVDSKSGRVSFEGDTVYSEPAESVSLSRLYFL